MATSTLASNGLVLRARRDDIFFSTMALVILGTVFLGFARSYYLAGVFQARLPNLLVHVHAGVFSAWILLFIAQTSLVSAGRLDLHRRLGILGAALAGAMVVLVFWSRQTRLPGASHRPVPCSIPSPSMRFHFSKRPCLACSWPGRFGHAPTVLHTNG